MSHNVKDLSVRLGDIAPQEEPRSRRSFVQRNLLTPRDTLATAYLSAAVLLGLFTAWAAGTNPDAFAEHLGLSIATSGGSNEILGQYAGFFLAVALVCLSSLTGRTPRVMSLVMLAVTFGGLAGGRLVSVTLNGGFSGFGPVVTGLHVFDVSAFLIAAWLIATEPCYRKQ